MGETQLQMTGAALNIPEIKDSQNCQVNKKARSLAGHGGSRHTCNPSILGGQGKWITRSGVQDQPGQDGEIPSLLKTTKISRAWWHARVVPATREAEAEESLEPRSWRLQ